MKKPIKPEIQRVATGLVGYISYRWRHPSVRDGKWSRHYTSRNAAKTGMGLTLWHARHRSDSAFIVHEQPLPGLSILPTRFEHAVGRATRTFGDTVVDVVWDGTVYTTTVRTVPHRPVTFLFCQLPDRFGFPPTNDYAFDITARSALHAAGKR